MTKQIHQRTRQDHSREMAEDYVEAIADAIAQYGVCRAVDLVSHFDVTHATVNNTVARLKRDGLAKSEPYGPIELTPAGRRLANKCRDRHQTVQAFLLKLGVSETIAALDAEGMEHHVSKETLTAMGHVLQHGWPKEK